MSRILDNAVSYRRHPPESGRSSEAVGPSWGIGTMSDPAAEVGTELLFENEVMRIWSMELAPGEESPYHLHTLDYVIVYVTPSVITRMEKPGHPGTTEEFADGGV